MSLSKIGFQQFSILVSFVVAALVASCSEDDSQIGYSEKQSVTSEAALDSYFEDVDDISATASLATEADLGGRKQRFDDRFCDNVKIKFLHKSNADPDTIITDFGLDPGCTDPRGNVRKGKIIIVFTPGSRFQTGNAVTTTFENFSLNGVKIEGTRTVTLTALDPPTQKIQLEGGKITWPDNTTATRDAQHLRKWDNKGTIQRSDDEMVIFGTNDFPGGASGLNREGKEYTMQIEEDIVFKVACAGQSKFLPVSGEKLLNINGRVITVNYGSGSCDNLITVTINGESKEVTVTRD
jgi:hypothetical protein